MPITTTVGVLGSGPGGYIAAIRARQLGLDTVLVEKDELGGVCLNWGCIPTKAMLKSAHLFLEIQEANQFGISLEKLNIDPAKVVERSRQVANQMSKGVSFLMKKNSVQIVNGFGKFQDKNTVTVSNAKGEEIERITAKYWIVAVGGRSKPFPNIAFDEDTILSSRGAMLQSKPVKNLAIIGAGAIGVEFADVYNAMGTNVEIIEYLDHLLPNEDEEVSIALEKSFKKRGMKLHLRKKVESIQKKQTGVSISVGSRDNESEKLTLEMDKVIIGIGVEPNTKGIGLEEIGVKLKKGFIDVDEYYQSTIPNVYAIGDCIPTPLLAHVASREAVLAAEAISIREGNPQKLHYVPINYQFVPGCTYCSPEVASVGLSEKKAKELGHEIVVGRFPFSASGRANAQGNTSGFVKVVNDKHTGEILGAHIIGEGATELISEYVVSATHEITSRLLSETIHPHPTLSEGLMEASADSLGIALNI